ncbi:hypothetical protein ACN38_g11061 [Penicillium nordicum]|uniref:Uncharacterized protein n=1 Tax=Penicillium nordicum TaxID=229535 RepID=A0A0M9WB27_9EURO|nr:hypothetical protein ACN38_g11061 [Penicillium nordicum]
MEVWMEVGYDGKPGEERESNATGFMTANCVPLRKKGERRRGKEGEREETIVLSHRAIRLISSSSNKL